MREVVEIELGDKTVLKKTVDSKSIWGHPFMIAMYVIITIFSIVCVIGYIRDGKPEKEFVLEIKDNQILCGDDTISVYDLFKDLETMKFVAAQFAGEKIEKEEYMKDSCLLTVRYDTIVTPPMMLFRKLWVDKEFNNTWMYITFECTDGMIIHYERKQELIICDLKIIGVDYRSANYISHKFNYISKEVKL